MTDKIVQLIDANDDNIFPLSSDPNAAKITMTTVDPGEGTPLDQNEFVAVYGGDPIVMDYSTSEINTGAKWIDGKTIYRRVFTGTVSWSANSRENVILWSGSPIADMIQVGGWVQYGTSGKDIVPLSYGPHDYRNLYVQNGTNNLILAIESSASGSNNSYQIWIEYTKNS